jgi:uncharacterized protein (DUF433 family)
MDRRKKILITSSPDILGGTPVFSGTRVPVQTLFDYLEGGDSIDEFLEQFPSVKRRQVLQVLEQSKIQLLRRLALGLSLIHDQPTGLLLELLCEFSSGHTVLRSRQLYTPADYSRCPFF